MRLLGARSYGWNTFRLDTILYYFDGDTILNRYNAYDINNVSNYQVSNSYNKLCYIKKSYCYWLQYDTPYYDNGSLSVSSGIAGYIRQDTFQRRVYVTNGKRYHFCQMPSDETEYLLYDFNLKVSDTIPCSVIHGVSSTKLVVDSIQNIMIDGKTMKVFYYRYFGYINSGPVTFSIIEGIGSNTNFTNSYDELIYYKNNEIEYYP